MWASSWKTSLFTVIIAYLELVMSKKDYFYEPICKPTREDSIFDCGNDNFRNGIDVYHLDMCGVRGMNSKPLKKLSKSELLRRNLTNLQTLNLSNCKIQEIQVGAFEGGRGITELDLSWNTRIQELDLNVFADLPNLQKLLLNQKKGLKFEENAEFPKSLSNLTVLSLESCQINSIPANLFQNLRNLEALNLHGNQIRQLDWILSLKSLKILLLNLDIDQVDPSVFSSLRNLQKLDLNCKRSNETFKKNGEVFPQSLMNLKELTINNCNLSTVIVPTYFKSLNNLEKLILINNQISTLDWILPLRSLKEFWFEKNNINELDLSVFSDLPHLQFLSLNNDPIKKFNRNAEFPKLTNLKTLSLQRCQLNSIPTNLFKNLGNLRRLQLGSNQFTSLSKIAFLPLQNLEFVGLAGNLWKCDCELGSLLDFLQKNNVRVWYPRKLKCSSCHV